MRKAMLFKGVNLGPGIFPLLHQVVVILISFQWYPAKRLRGPLSLDRLY